MGKKRRFKLKAEFMNGGDVHVGGFREGQPDRVTLSEDSPYVEGGEYAVYVPDVLREVEPLPTVEEKMGALKSLAAKASKGESIEMKEEADEPESEDEPTVDEIMSTHEPAEEPTVEEGDELPLESEDDADALEHLPSVDELEDMNRSELENLALKLGILDDIEGSGSGGYITVPDFREQLEPLLEEVDEK